MKKTSILLKKNNNKLKISLFCISEKNSIIFFEKKIHRFESMYKKTTLITVIQIKKKYIHIRLTVMECIITLIQYESIDKIIIFEY